MRGDEVMVLCDLNARVELSPWVWAAWEAWYPFSAAGITICQLLAVHLRLHARPMLGPVGLSDHVQQKQTGQGPKMRIGVADSGLLWRFFLSSQPSSQPSQVKTVPAAHPLAMKRFLSLEPIYRICRAWVAQQMSAKWTWFATRRVPYAEVRAGKGGSCGSVCKLLAGSSMQVAQGAKMRAWHIDRVLCV